MPLEEYQAKRDFSATPEPSGGEHVEGPLRFVVQKHHARALHYDFRLELDGVLMSWAVPKGPSLDPADKRLAVHVEDHPIDYADFEGVIPSGEYGAGNVIVWDRGSWEPVGDPRAGLAKGDFKFELAGEKLAGRWVLVRLKPRPGEKRENWLLIKERDDHVRARAEFDLLAEKPLSVISGIDVEDVATLASGSAAESDAAADPGPPATGADSEIGAVQADAPPASYDPAKPPALALCTLVTQTPATDEWLGEVKYDGYRMTVSVDRGRVRCFSRNGEEWTERVPAVASAAARLPVTDALLDGEIVVFDERGVSRFGLLQEALSAHPKHVTFVAFDLLGLNGLDTTALPTVKRKELLRAVVGDEPADGPLRMAQHVEGGVDALLEVACAQGLEGVVAKRADGPYPVGRTRAWLKVKCRRAQEFVVGGYTEPAAGRAAFGALLVGYYDQDRLVYTGRVGSGFSDAQLQEVGALLGSLHRDAPPFDPAPSGREATAHWVDPALVVQVAFTEWTASGHLRQPSFKGLRADRDPREVVREIPDAEPLDAPAEPTETEAALTGAEAAPSQPTTAGPPGTVAGIRITNPDKRLFPDSTLSKSELAEYYEAVSGWMLPEVGFRPLTLVRCPVGDGRGTCFYQRHPDRGLPGAVSRLTHVLTDHPEADEWLTIHDASGLVALAQMGVAEIHTWLSRSDAPARPDRIVLDLDPGPDVTWEAIVAAARLVRGVCEPLGFSAFVKSTGSKGLHVVVPIEPVWEFSRLRPLARALAETAASQAPDRLTTKMAKSQRNGRIFLDYVRNSEGASAVAPYSTRYREGPTVAVPLAWEEIEPTDDLRHRFTPALTLKRLQEGIDPWRDIERRSAGARTLRAAENELVT